MYSSYRQLFKCGCSDASGDGFEEEFSEENYQQETSDSDDEQKEKSSEVSLAKIVRKIIDEETVKLGSVS